MIFITGGAWQGKTAYAKGRFGEEYTIINQYHRKVREQLQAGLDPIKEAEKLLTEDGKLIIISDETGCGLVPVDAFERAYREQSGRVNCYLAGRAEQVIRVLCGIGERIK